LFRFATFGRRLWVLWIVAALALSSCHVWRDHGEVAVSCTGAMGASSVDVAGGGAERSGSICRGSTQTFVAELEAGEKASVTVEYSVGDALLTVELYDGPPEADGTVLEASPVWNDSGVEVRDLITESGEYRVELSYPDDGERNGPKRLSYDLEVETEEYAESVRYLEPSDGATESASGTRADPWTDWSAAVGELGPGGMLVVGSGTWSETGECENDGVPCVEVESTPKIDCSSGAADGLPDRPIIVAAREERSATIRGDGTGAALRIENCEHWEVRGLTLRSSKQGGEDGSWGVLAKDSPGLLLRRLLVDRPNPDRSNAGILFNSSSSSRVEQSEVYDFSDVGIQVSQSYDITIEETYLRAAPGGAEEGILGFRSSRSRFANVVVEGAKTGFRLVAAGENAGVTEVGDFHEFVGAIALDVSKGFEFDAKTCLQQCCDMPGSEDCGGDEDCTCEGPNYMFRHNVIEDSVVVDAGAGFVIEGGSDNRIRDVSVFDVIDRAYRLHNGPQPSGNGWEPLSITESLAVDGSVGYFVHSDVRNWSIGDVNAYEMETPFEPENLEPGPTYQWDPELDGCFVYVPEGSPMTSLNGASLGANIVRRYRPDPGGENEYWKKTTERLWDQQTGAFPCGRVVPDGTNDPSGDVCANVHERLDVGTDACSIPW